MLTLKTSNIFTMAAIPIQNKDWFINAFPFSFSHRFKKIKLHLMKRHVVEAKKNLP